MTPARARACMLIIEAERAILLERSQGTATRRRWSISSGRKSTPPPTLSRKPTCCSRAKTRAAWRSGNSFSEDAARSAKRFRLMLSNPPFMAWNARSSISSGQRIHETKAPRRALRRGFAAYHRRLALVPSAHARQALLKTRPAAASPSSPSTVSLALHRKRTPAAWAQSEIRRWIIENDWLEGIVAPCRSRF